MPITITVPPLQNGVGPGMYIHLASDFVGPFPAEAEWLVTLSADSEEQFQFYRVARPCTGPLTTFQVLVNTDEIFWQPVRAFPRQDAVTFIHARINTNSGVIDSGVQNFPWVATEGLGAQINSSVGATTVQGGFTAQDRVLLQQTDARTQLLGNLGDLVVETASGPITTTLATLFSRKSLDLLTLDELTAGPTCDPVRASLGLWFYGVIVRVTTIPEDIVFKTPDQQWSFPDLAVLRIFRGADLEFRRGIHTPTFMQENPWQWGWGFLNENPILGVPPETSIAVDWRVGCCGQVFVQRLP